MGKNVIIPLNPKELLSHTMYFEKISENNFKKAKNLLKYKN